MFVVVLRYRNSISVIAWQCYDVRDEEKTKPTLLPTQGIFNLHIGMVLEELAFDDDVSYTQRGNIKPVEQ